MSGSAAVSVRDLSFTYPAARKSPALLALSGVSFEAEKGKSLGLLGPNGSGKSTLFKILATAAHPGSGSISILGHDIVRERAAVRRSLGVVFQHPSLDLKLTVNENIRFQGRLYGLSGPALSRAVDAAVERFGLGSHANSAAETLSGGMRRRVELAKALLHGPEILILDEPTTGLDPAARREFWRHLQDLRSERSLTILTTTHLMDEAEALDRLAILDRGRLLALGTPAELKATVSGDVLTVESAEPQKLQALMLDKLGIKSRLIDAVLRVEQAQAHLLIPRIVESFPELAQAVHFSKPSLEDVFLGKTGRRFEIGKKEGMGP